MTSSHARSPNDTIFALSSGAGRAGIAVIRVSGPCAPKVCASLCDSSLPSPRRAGVRLLRDPANRDVIDQALVLFMPGPNSFTGEDSVELQVHGGRAVVARLLALLAEFPGLRLAEPGEFTRRAFLHGRLDLIEVEGLADLLAAETEAQRRQAWFTHSRVSGVYEGWRAEILSILALLEAAIDFADEDDGIEQSIGEIGPRIDALQGAIADGLDEQGRGERLRDGLRIVLAGPVNAGKSCLFNRLIAREAAIVSSEKGTTRDVLEVSLDIGGFPATLCDTAGLRDDAPGAVEREGQRRARDQLGRADIVLWLNAPDCPVPGPPPSCRAKLVRLLNKVDQSFPLQQATALPEQGGSTPYDMAISARTGQGMDDLWQWLADYAADQLSPGEQALVTRQRHRSALRQCRKNLGQAGQNLRNMPLELTAEHIRCAAHELGRLVGRVEVEDVLEEIFKTFCIGK